jgi:hypothetical protein
MSKCKKKASFTIQTNTKALAFHKEWFLPMVPKLGGDLEDGGTGLGTKPI